MVHVKITDCNFNGIRHEFWEPEKYVKHLEEPACGRWSPYYVCYTYR